MKKEQKNKKIQDKEQKNPKCTCGYEHHHHAPTCPCYKDYIM